jgi:hypothetical protein
MGTHVGKKGKKGTAFGAGMWEIEDNVVMHDNIYECEAKRPVIREGVKVRDWLIKPVIDVITEQLDEYRCKDCHGRIKLLRKLVANGPAPHAVHISRQDSEHCRSGYYFRQNPERTHRMSSNPVE